MDLAEMRKKVDLLNRYAKEYYEQDNPTVSDGEYDKRKGAIARARELLLTRYNLFAQIVAAIEAAPADRGDGSCVLVTRHHTRLYPCAALSDLAHHIRRLFKRS